MNTLSRYFTVLFFLIAISSQAQEDSSKTGEPSFVRKMQEIGRKEAIRSKEKFEENQIELKQARHLIELQKANHELSLILSNSYDTIGHRRKNKEIEKDLALATAKMNESNLQEQSLRNVAVSEAMLEELQGEIRNQQQNLDEYAEKLLNYKRTIDSIYSDSALYIFSDDSIKTTRYLQKLTILGKDIIPIELSNENLLIRLEQLQNETNELAFRIRNRKNEMDRFNKIRFSLILKTDTSILKDQNGVQQSFSETLQYSYEKEKRVFLYYLQSRTRGIAVLLFASLLVAGIFYYAIQTIKEASNVEAPSSLLILKSPMLSATVLVLSIGQFFFINPPFIFTYFLLMVGTICLLFLLKGFMRTYWWRFYCFLAGLCFLAGIDNLLLQYSLVDKWLILLLALLGILLGIWGIRSVKKIETKEPRIRYFFYFLILCELAALVANLLGRWNLAKILLVCGYLGVLTGYLFLWVIRLINETFQLVSLLSNQTGKTFLNFRSLKFGTKAPRFLYYLLVMGWLNLLARNFYTYRQITEPIQDFFRSTRTVGSYSFSVGGMIIFLLVLGTSLLISKILSLFAEDSHESISNSGQNSERPNAGSWMLLIRIFVICVGFFLALASAGIPLDRIAIVLGGLSVGIGLGLQGLVSNLISGLILAFEKPVEVGDLVDINSKTGRMKSIGFRSSSIQLTDGSSLIIPNGDLLNHHLVNWSKGNSLKKSTLILCVSIEQSLENVQALITEIVRQDPRVLSSPPVQVNALNFQPQGMDLEISYWTRNIRETDDLKSDLIGRIQLALIERTLVLPTPRQIIQITQSEPIKNKDSELG
jgi:small-conductance mechanosensitive channel